jgi:hypothetical protein
VLDLAEKREGPENPYGVVDRSYANFRECPECELRLNGVLGSAPLAWAVCPPGLHLPVGMDAGVRQRTMGPWVT